MEALSTAEAVPVQTVPAPRDSFRQYFEILPGVDQHICDAVFRIRHEVYCEDLQFESARADGRETDEYDAHSVHCLMRRSDSSAELVGCTRLVLAQKEGIDYLMPFERSCADAIDRSIIDPAKLHRDEIAEVSRLAVVKRYRQRRGESRTEISLTANDFGSPAQPRFPHVPVGLYLASIAIALRYGLKTLFVLTEPRMAQHFCKLGVMIRPIGKVIEHRGERLPSVMQVDEIIGNMRPQVRPTWQAINEQIDAYIDEHWTLPSEADVTPAPALVEHLERELVHSAR